jgi:hypothetical protein
MAREYADVVDGILAQRGFMQAGPQASGGRLLALGAVPAPKLTKSVRHPSESDLAIVHRQSA